MSRLESMAAKVFRFGIVPRLRQGAAETITELRRRRRAPGAAAQIRVVRDARPTAVQAYWNRHTVNSRPFLSARASARYLEWRFQEYPLFRELSGLWGSHDGETVLDYGCGPGNDLVGFSLYTGARRIIGADVSDKALGLARDRLALHGVGPDRVELLRLPEDPEPLPLEDGSVDFISSQGVLHHTSDPEAILRDLHRVLKPGGRASVMVYNRDSVWLHLYVAYEKQVLEGAWPGLDVVEAFSRSTDGEECPIARCYSGDEFVAICEAAGFRAEYVGGYLTQLELRAMGESWGSAIADERLAPEHRAFLRELSYDYAHRPMRNGFHAGYGGTYRLRKEG